MYYSQTFRIDQKTLESIRCLAPPTSAPHHRRAWAQDLSASVPHRPRSPCGGADLKSSSSCVASTLLRQSCARLPGELVHAARRETPAVPSFRQLLACAEGESRTRLGWI